LFRKRSDLSNISIQDIIFTCFCYRLSDYFVVNYEFQEINKEFAKNLKLKKKKKEKVLLKLKPKTNSKLEINLKIKKSKNPKLKRKYSYIIVVDFKDTENSIEALIFELYKSVKEIKYSIEKIILFKKQIYKSIPII